MKNFEEFWTLLNARNRTILATLYHSRFSSSKGGFHINKIQLTLRSIEMIIQAHKTSSGSKLWKHELVIDFWEYAEGIYKNHVPSTDFRDQVEQMMCRFQEDAMTAAKS